MYKVKKKLINLFLCTVDTDVLCARAYIKNVHGYANVMQSLCSKPFALSAKIVILIPFIKI